MGLPIVSYILAMKRPLQISQQVGDFAHYTLHKSWKNLTLTHTSCPCMNRWMVGRMVGWMNGLMDVLTDGRMEGCKESWKDERTKR